MFLRMEVDHLNDSIDVFILCKVELWILKESFISGRNINLRDLLYPSDLMIAQTKEGLSDLYQ